jgi:hypothetical protein
VNDMHALHCTYIYAYMHTYIHPTNTYMYTYTYVYYINACVTAALVFRVALEHRRLLDRGIFDMEAHEDHVFDFKRKLLACVESLLGGRECGDTFHPAVAWTCPGAAYRSSGAVLEYCSQVSRLAGAVDATAVVLPETIMIADDKVSAN